MASAVGVALVPVAARVLGAVAAMLRRPGPVLTSIVQHLAAGVVFAAAAGEILPGLKHGGAAIPILIGGTSGVVAMLLIKQLGRRAAGPIGLVALLYLVTEELLVEAHEQPDTPAATAAFFVGFLALLLLEEAL